MTPSEAWGWLMLATVALVVLGLVGVFLASVIRAWPEAMERAREEVYREQAAKLTAEAAARRAAAEREERE